MAMWHKRPVIDVKTLEVWESRTACAKYLGVSVGRITQCIEFGRRVRGRRVEDFEYWQELDWRDKEKMAQSNFYFFDKVNYD